MQLLHQKLIKSGVLLIDFFNNRTQQGNLQNSEKPLSDYL